MKIHTIIVTDNLKTIWDPFFARPQFKMGNLKIFGTHFLQYHCAKRPFPLAKNGLLGAILDPCFFFISWYKDEKIIEQGVFDGKIVRRTWLSHHFSDFPASAWRVLAFTPRSFVRVHPGVLCSARAGGRVGTPGHARLRRRPDRGAAEVHERRAARTRQAREHVTESARAHRYILKI